MGAAPAAPKKEAPLRICEGYDSGRDSGSRTGHGRGQNKVQVSQPIQRESRLYGIPNDARFNFYSYSVEGLFFDLDSIIFAESGYIPWTEQSGIKLKYEKRIIRYAALLICAVYSQNPEQARTILGNFIEKIKALRENPQSSLKHDLAPPKDVISHALLNFMKVTHTMHAPAHAAEWSQNLQAFRAFTDTFIKNFDEVLQFYPSTHTVSRLKLTKLLAGLNATDLNTRKTRSTRFRVTMPGATMTTQSHGSRTLPHCAYNPACTPLRNTHTSSWMLLRSDCWRESNETAILHTTYTREEYVFC